MDRSGTIAITGLKWSLASDDFVPAGEQQKSSVLVFGKNRTKMRIGGSKVLQLFRSSCPIFEKEIEYIFCSTFAVH